MKKKKKTKLRKPPKGKYLTLGRGWMLTTTGGKPRAFHGTLMHVINKGKDRFAIFSVPK